jgi:AraC-like DNA-binding protein
MTIVESCRFIPGSPDILRARASARHFDLHMHDTFSVVVLMEGSASLRSNRWSKTAQAGDVFFFNPFEVHSGCSPDQPARYEVLYPSRRFVLDCLPVGEFRSSLPLVRTDVLHRCATTGTFVDALSNTTPSAETVETALRKLLQSCAFEPAGFAESGITAVRAACQFINQRYMCAIRTDMLANRVGLHKSHFVRIFHRATGIAPQTYVRQVRIAKARELICAGAELCEAAQSVGFCDQAHLTREFRKVYGVTPGRLSRDLRANLY